MRVDLLVVDHHRWQMRRLRSRMDLGHTASHRDRCWEEDGDSLDLGELVGHLQVVACIRVVRHDLAVGNCSPLEVVVLRHLVVGRCSAKVAAGSLAVPPGLEVDS